MRAHTRPEPAPFRGSREALVAASSAEGDKDDEGSEENPAAGSAGKGGDSSLAQASVSSVLLLVLGYSFSSSCLTAANDWALELYPFASLLVVVQVAATVLIVGVVKLFRLAPVSKLERGTVWQYMPAASMYFITMSASQHVMAQAGVQVFIAMKCTVPLVTFVAEAYILGGPKPTYRSATALVVIIIGAMVFLRGEGVLMTSGVISWGLFYLLVMPVDSLLIKSRLDDLSLTPWGMVLYNNLLALPMYIPISQLTGEFSELYTAALPTREAFAVIAVTCALGCSLSFFQLSIRHSLSATTFVVLGVINKGLSLMLDTLFVRQAREAVLTWYSILGISLLIGGGVAWQFSMGRQSITKHKLFSTAPECAWWQPAWVTAFNVVLLAAGLVIALVYVFAGVGELVGGVDSVDSTTSGQGSCLMNFSTSAGVHECGWPCNPATNWFMEFNSSLLRNNHMLWYQGFWFTTYSMVASSYWSPLHTDPASYDAIFGVPAAHSASALNTTCATKTYVDPAVNAQKLDPNASLQFSRFVMDRCPRLMVTAPAVTLRSQVPAFNPTMALPTQAILAAYPAARLVVLANRVQAANQMFHQCLRCSYFGKPCDPLQDLMLFDGAPWNAPQMFKNRFGFGSDHLDGEFGVSLLILDKDFAVIKEAPVYVGPGGNVTSAYDARLFKSSTDKLYVSYVDYASVKAEFTGEPTPYSAKTQLIGQLTVEPSCGATIHFVTVVTDGRLGEDAPHKNLGLFEHKGTLMALDWAFPTATLSLFPVDGPAPPPQILRTSNSTALEAMAAHTRMDPAAGVRTVDNFTIHNGPALVALPSSSGGGPGRSVAPGGYLGLGHIYRDYGQPGGMYGHHYLHVFFRLASDPPFAMLGISPEVCFPSSEYDGNYTACETVQFGSGLVLDGEHLVVGLGVMDCDSRFHRIPLHRVLDMLLPVT